ALASFDRTHNFQLFGLYELPFGRGKHLAQEGVANALAGGWQINWTFGHLSGTPFTVTADGTSLNAPGNTQTADVVGPVHILGGNPAGSGGTCAATNLSCHYFDPAAFAPPTGARFGTGGRDIVRGPGFTNLDMSLFRNFKLTERFNFQFRVEAFGLTNTPHFNNPTNNGANADISRPNFG